MAERQHRSYSRRQKVTAVIAAELTSVSVAAEQTGVPRKTVEYWFDDPAFASVRQKTREDLAVESMAMAHTVLGEIQRRLPEFEPRDLSILYGILTDKGQLLSGHATDRIETRNVTSGMDDHEREALRNLLTEAIEAEVVEA